ncbi:pyocin knob domain-containing protein [Photorhabdus stackebrandtii]|uniref:pyocin knob domain-containing protein n=1 Tax=Photorhabdus stackebrandtii TaxID=1123042 RepID=UPI001F6028B3|nr:pyocin knob domain-containing protein [Photorhabdus stackebrandtii]
MSAKNDFKAFSIGSSANVVSQEKYEVNQSLQTGFTLNDIPADLLNKVLRQSSTIASMIANFIATQSGDDVLDNGDIVKLTEQLNRALEKEIATKVPNASLIQKGVVQLTDVLGNSDTLAVTQKLVQEIINSLRDNINAKVHNTRKVNGKVLAEDINITSQDIFAGQAINLGNNADLDNYKTPGVYYQEYNSSAQSGNNYPEPFAGSLVVLKAAGVVQRYFVYNSSRVYTRSQFHDNPWTPWVREYNAVNKPTAEDVGAYTKADSDARYITGIRKVNGKALATDISITSQDILADQAINLGGSANLDSYKTPGIYYQESNAHAKNGSNYPEPFAGSLIVLKAAGVIQRYFVYNSSRVYTRSQFHDNPWTPWVREYNAVNKPTAEDVGAYTKADSDARYITGIRKVNGKALAADINITSQDIFAGQAINLGGSANLDSYKTPGIYYQESNAHAKNGSNYPEPFAGSLIVLKAAGVIQRYFVYNSSRVYTRSQFHDNPWTPWAQEYNTLNKPSANNIEEYKKSESANIYITGIRLGAEVYHKDGNDSTEMLYSSPMQFSSNGQWFTIVRG